MVKDRNKNNNYFNNFVSVSKFNDGWNWAFYFFINYFENCKYPSLIIDIIKYTHSNKNLFLVLFLIMSWFWSNFLLNILCNFILIDSLIISLLVLQNNCPNHNSRRLCKNTILYALSNLNIIKGMFMLVVILFIYLESR